MNAAYDPYSLVTTRYSALRFNFKFKMFINRINTLKNVNRPLGRCFSSGENFSPAKLAFTAYEDLANSQKGIPFLIMHGLLGSKQNWTSLCKVYSQNVNPARKIIALDLRNHGDSEHSQHHSYSLLVEDVRHFLLDLNIKKISLMGHSMGGRCAMLFALRYPELLEKLIVVDISPISGPQINEMPVILGVMKSIQMPKNVPLSVARTIVDNHLAEVISKKDVRAFILTNLVATEDQSYKWRVNVTALSEGFHEMFNFPALDNAQYKGETLFIGGARSNYLPKSDYTKILKFFPKAELKYIEGAGHWVHAEKPNEFLKLTMDFLNKTSSSIS